MAEFTPNRIYTYVRSAIKKVYPNMYVTGSPEPIPSVDVAVQIHEMNHYRPIGGVTLDSEDEQWRVAFDVNVYTNIFNDGKHDAYEIMRVCEDAFRRLHFIESECVPLSRANNRVTRLAARFDRQIGRGDQMPEGD